MIGRDQAHQEAEQALDQIDNSWVWRLLGKVVALWNDAIAAISGVSLPIVIAVLAVLAGGVLWALRRMTWSRRTQNGMLFDQQHRDAAAHRAAAERLAATGQWAAAVQERLRAIARDLEERAVVTPLPGRTALELAQTAARVLPAQAAALHTAATIFNDIAYGSAPGTPEAYRLLAELDDRLRTARVAQEAVG